MTSPAVVVNFYQVLRDRYKQYIPLPPTGGHWSVAWVGPHPECHAHIHHDTLVVELRLEAETTNIFQYQLQIRDSDDPNLAAVIPVTFELLYEMNLRQQLKNATQRIKSQISWYIPDMTEVKARLAWLKTKVSSIRVPTDRRRIAALTASLVIFLFILFIMFAAPSSAAPNKATPTPMSWSWHTATPTQTFTPVPTLTATPGQQISTTDTLKTTATLIPLVVPTLQVVDKQVTKCSDSLPSRITVGKQATTSNDFNLRSGPGLTYSSPYIVDGETTVNIIDGPKCGNNLTWWKVQYQMGNKKVTGWLAESQYNDYHLYPIKN